MKRTHRPPYSALVLSFFVFFLVACDGSETELSKKPSPVLAVNNRPKPVEITEAVPLEPVSITISKEERVRFNYSAKGRRDPFQSIIISQGVTKKPRMVESLPPLQRKDITDLKLIGIVWGSFGPRAIITTSSGKGYTVHTGTRIGVNHGVISKITKNEVIVEETLLNIFGEPRKSTVVMALHSEKERVE